MPRRTRRQIVGRHENHERAMRERRLRSLLYTLRRKWQARPIESRRCDAA